MNRNLWAGLSVAGGGSFARGAGYCKAEKHEDPTCELVTVPDNWASKIGSMA